MREDRADLFIGDILVKAAALRAPAPAAPPRAYGLGPTRRGTAGRTPSAYYRAMTDDAELPQVPAAPSERADLSRTRRQIISAVLDALPPPTTQELRGQLAMARVVGGRPTFLDLSIALAAPSAEFADGPLPVRALVTSSGSQLIGEILVWIQGGYLTGLEYDWYTDDPPAQWPSPDQLQTGPAESD